MHSPSRPFVSRGTLLIGTLVLAASVSLPIRCVRAEPPKVIESPTVGTAGKAVIAVSENGKTQTIEAEGRDVSVTGSHNKITVSGKCHALTVSGDGNEVTLGSVVSISTPGNGNHVAYVEPSGGESVQVTNVGAGNVIRKK